MQDMETTHNLGTRSLTGSSTVHAQNRKPDFKRGTDEALRPAAPAATLTMPKSVHRGGADKERPERGLVHRVGERSQRGRVLDLPATKRLGHVFKEHESILTKAFCCIYAGISYACPTSGNRCAGFYCRVSLIIRSGRMQALVLQNGSGAYKPQV